MQGFEGAPDATLEVEPAYADALDGVQPGDDLVLLTWLHLADRGVLKVHPRSDPAPAPSRTVSKVWPTDVTTATRKSSKFSVTTGSKFRPTSSPRKPDGEPWDDLISLR